VLRADAIKNRIGEKVVLIRLFFFAPSRIGRRYAHDDPKLKQLSRLIKDLLTMTDASGGVANNFPLLARYLPFLTEKKAILNVRRNVMQFLSEDIEKHKTTLDANNPRDFIDMYLIEMQNHKEQNVESSFTGKKITNNIIKSVRFSDQVLVIFNFMLARKGGIILLHIIVNIILKSL
jgi:Cytochrome P450